MDISSRSSQQGSFIQKLLLLSLLLTTIFQLLTNSLILFPYFKGETRLSLPIRPVWLTFLNNIDDRFAERAFTEHGLLFDAFHCGWSSIALRRFEKQCCLFRDLRRQLCLLFAQLNQTDLFFCDWIFDGLWKDEYLYHEGLSEEWIIHLQGKQCKFWQELRILLNDACIWPLNAFLCWLKVREQVWKYRKEYLNIARRCRCSFLLFLICFLLSPWIRKVEIARVRFKDLVLRIVVNDC